MKYKERNLVKRIISAMIGVFMIVTFIGPEIIVNADEYSAIASEPSVKVEITKPSSGEEYFTGDIIEVEGKVIPQPFELQDQNKEIVLVIDTSGSMEGSKMRNLKKAANNFIEKMTDVPNLKIGIVTYASTGTIQSARINNKTVSMIPASNSDKLKSIITGLSAVGGTNSGEGLRLATYLLGHRSEVDSTANKTVIFMSDGIPTFYTNKYKASGYNSKEYYYTDVTTSTSGYSNNSGAGNSDTKDLLDLGYATTIGEIIKSYGYNAFTIGYGLDNTGTSRIKKIHESMGGSIDAKDGTFFATDTGAIDSVFNKIANNILDSYNINNVEMNLTLEGFELEVSDYVDVENQIIKIDPIKYKKVTEDGVTPIKYEAPEVPFRFKVTVTSTTGGNVNIFENGNISFKWNNKDIVYEIPELIVGIKENIPTPEEPVDIPNITATLNENYKSNLNNGETTKVEYTISAEEFTYSENLGTPITESNKKKDIVFVVDLHSDMYSGGYFKTEADNIIEGIFQRRYISYIDGVIGNLNTMINSKLINSLDDLDYRVGVVGFNSESRLVQELQEPSKFNAKLNERWWSDKELSDAPRDYERSITSSIQKAKKLLSTANDEREKYIIIISSGDVSYDNLQLGLDNDKYNYLSLILDLEENSLQHNYNINQLYKDLGVNQDNIILKKVRYKKFISWGFNYGAISEGIEEIKRRINVTNSGTEDTDKKGVYTVNNARLSLYTDNTLALSNSDSSNKLDQGVQTTIKDEQGNNKEVTRYQYDLGALQYEVTKVNGQNQYKYTPIANTIPIVNFDVTANGYGDLRFVNDYSEQSDGLKNRNSISYSNIQDVTIQKDIITPTFNVLNPIKHGVFESYKNRNVQWIDDNDNSIITVAQEANVTFAGQLETTVTQGDISLAIDSRIEGVDGTPKVYIVDDSNNLNPLGDMVEKNNKYIYTFKPNDSAGINMVDNKYTIVVMYNTKLPKEKGSYINKLQYNNGEKSATIKVGEESLPNLF